jgi:hypothetical protein
VDAGVHPRSHARDCPRRRIFCRDSTETDVRSCSCAGQAIRLSSAPVSASGVSPTPGLISPVIVADKVPQSGTLDGIAACPRQRRGVSPPIRGWSPPGIRTSASLEALLDLARHILARLLTGPAEYAESHASWAKPASSMRDDQRD